MEINPAIVVVAFNRAAPLQRLLNSLSQAIYTNNQVELIISIDKSNDTEVKTIAENFVWKFGAKKIICHDEHLGLKKHILWCGSLTKQYEALIILEDDLLVSPYFYDYATQASQFYKNDSQVAGISLYNYQVAESCFHPFKAIDDGSDVYFMQVASSWGQLFTQQQWQKFETWFAQHSQLPPLPWRGDGGEACVPNYLQQWSKHSWKKHFIHYLISENRYFVFPRLSLSTNFEEDGVNSSTKNVFHVPLQLSQKSYCFQTLSDSKALYDAWFEMQPQCLNHYHEELKKYNYEVDLYGTKEITQNSIDYILTTKDAQSPLLSYSAKLFPLETNVALNLKGNEIALYLKANNTFNHKKLNLKNYLEELNKNNDVSFSIVIPVLELNETQYTKTLDSIIKQAYSFIEVIVVTTKNNEFNIEKVSSNYHLNLQLISVDNQPTLDELIHKGFKASQHNILTWLYIGTEFNVNTCNYVNSIFKSHPTTNWLRGIEETTNDKYLYERLNVFKYRLTKGEVFNQLQKGKLNDSLEGHFFRKNCLGNFNENVFSQQTLFFYFIQYFQLTVVVKKLNTTPHYSNIKAISAIEKVELIRNYKHFAYNTSLKLKCLSFFLSLPFIGEESSHWYYTSLHHFPDVLRYNTKNEIFYLSKH